MKHYPRRYAHDIPPEHMAPEDRVDPETPPLKERREKKKEDMGIERLHCGRKVGCFVFYLAWLDSYQLLMECDALVL